MVRSSCEPGVRRSQVHHGQPDVGIGSAAFEHLVSLDAPPAGA